MNRIPATQRAAHKEILPELSDKRLQVYNIIADAKRGIALYLIAEKLHWPINCVSGRVTELHDLGYIVDSGQRETNPHTKKRVILWKCAPQPRQWKDECGQLVFA